MAPPHTGRFLGLPYDWRRPTWAWCVKQGPERPWITGTGLE
jgi:hypothetical protein